MVVAHGLKRGTNLLQFTEQTSERRAHGGIDIRVCCLAQHSFVCCIEVAPCLLRGRHVLCVDGKWCDGVPHGLQAFGWRSCLGELIELQAHP